MASSTSWTTWGGRRCIWEILIGPGPHSKKASHCARNWATGWLSDTYLDGLACVAGTEGGAERAVRLFGAAEALREAVGWHRNLEEEALREPYLRTARTQLEEGLWEQAWAEGRAMSFEEAVSYAMVEEEASA